jgi:hypothetical protein
MGFRAWSAIRKTDIELVPMRHNMAVAVELAIDQQMDQSKDIRFTERAVSLADVPSVLESYEDG